MSQKQITEFFKKSLPKSKKSKHRRIFKNGSESDKIVRLVNIMMPLSFDSDEGKYDSDCFIVTNVLSSPDDSPDFGDPVTEDINSSNLSKDDKCVSPKVKKLKANDRTNGSNENIKDPDFKDTNPIHSTYTDTVKENNIEESIISQFKNDGTLSSDIDDYYTSFLSEMVSRFIDDTSLHHLFESKERELIMGYCELPFEYSRVLFCRMYWLKNKWNKVSKIVTKYLKCDEKDPVVRQAVTSLMETGYLINGNDHMTLDDWFEFLNNNDLLLVCKNFKILPEKRDKTSLIAAVRNFAKKPVANLFVKSNSLMESKVLKWLSAHFEECIKLDNKAKLIFDKLHLLMYLGMNPAVLREKKLVITLSNIKYGKQSYPSMHFKHIDSPATVFPSQQHFDEYCSAYNLYEKVLSINESKNALDKNQEIMKLCSDCLVSYQQLLTNNDLAYKVPIAKWLHRFTPGYVYVKTLEFGIDFFKSATEASWHKALLIIDALLEQTDFRQNKRALWHEKKALLYQMKFKNKHKVASTLMTALQDPHVYEYTKASLEKKARNLAKMKSSGLDRQVCDNLLKLASEPIEDLPFITIQGKAMENTQGKKATYVHMDSNGDYVYSSVEECALTYYKNTTCYTQGVHWEGRIITTIFCLLFWDIIYDELHPGMGIFLSPFQEAPLDLYTDAFYTNRKTIIQKRLDLIKNGFTDIEQIIEYMNDHFKCRKEEEVSILSGVTINQVSVVFNVTRCLGRDGLYAICSRLASDYHYFHSGFPDLTIWNSHNNKVKFVEVKGEGDTLSHKQIQWMKYLIESGIETEVCHVARTNKRKKSVSPKKAKKLMTSPEKNAKNLKSLNNAADPTQENNSKCAIRILNPENINAINSCSPKVTPQKRKSSESTSCASSPLSGVYVRSPTKTSRGVGYISSPEKSSGSPGTNSPNSKAFKKRLSLSLTKRRLYDCDK